MYKKVIPCKQLQPWWPLYIPGPPATLLAHTLHKVMVPVPVALPGSKINVTRQTLALGVGVTTLTDGSLS
jgi:hypothetical protein